jgi:hypothetical protein
MPVEIGEIVTNVEPSQGQGGQPPAQGAGGEVTQELVIQVADRVMALMRQELKFEYERRRFSGSAGRMKGVR